MSGQSFAGLHRRLAVLEAAAPTKQGAPRVILLVGMWPGDQQAQPLRRVSILGTVLHRRDDEAEAAFRDRIEAFAIAQGQAVALGCHMLDGAAA